MAYLCKRCYINAHENLTKKQIKQLNISSVDFYCDNCGKLKKFVVEKKIDEDGFVYEDCED